MITLRELRKQRRLSQRELASKMGFCSGATICQYEIGQRTPSVRIAKEIAIFFEVSLDELEFKNHPEK